MVMGSPKDTKTISKSPLESSEEYEPLGPLLASFFSQEVGDDDDDEDGEDVSRMHKKYRSLLGLFVSRMSSEPSNV